MAMSNIRLFIAALMLVNMGSTQEWIGSRVVDGRCFLYVYGWTEWDQALAECGNIGGTLATIISRDQLNKIVSALAIDPEDFVWIGANDKVTEGTFVWTETNQQAPDIPRDLWDQHYPADKDGANDCVYFRHGVIVNDYCENPSSYLCMEPNFTTTKCTPSTTSSETTSTSTTTIPTTTTLPTSTLPTTIPTTTTLPTTTPTTTTLPTTTSTTTTLPTSTLPTTIPTTTTLPTTTPTTITPSTTRPSTTIETKTTQTETTPVTTTPTTTTLSITTPTTNILTSSTMFTTKRPQPHRHSSPCQQRRKDHSHKSVHSHHRQQRRLQPHISQPQHQRLFRQNTLRQQQRRSQPHLPQSRRHMNYN